MTYRDKIKDDYFEWMYDITCGGRFARGISYRKLLMCLHDTEFIFSIPKDANRAEDGVDLRRRFALSHNDKYLAEYLDGPCSVLEMILALSIRCEETIMDDPMMGDRTGQWFWYMINNMGLGSMTDSRFDMTIVKNIIERFLNREYEPNGEGGLFTITNCEYNLQTVEIWSQLCWYLDSIT